MFNAKQLNSEGLWDYTNLRFLQHVRSIQSAYVHRKYIPTMISPQFGTALISYQPENDVDRLWLSDRCDAAHLAARREVADGDEHIGGVLMMMTSPF